MEILDNSLKREDFRMKLTAKTQYAVSAMLDVALHQYRGPVSLLDVSKRQAISQSYLEQLFARMRKQGLVKSTRGPGGGYQIKPNLEDVTVDQIVQAMQAFHGRNKPTDESLTDNVALLSEQLETQSLWDELSNVMHDFFSRITLAQLVQSNTDVSTLKSA